MKNFQPTRKLFRFAAGAVLVVLALSFPLRAAPPSFARPGTYPVGVRTLVLVDSSREDPYAGGPIA